MGDPLFADGVDFGVVVIVILKVLIGFGIAVGATAVMIWFERKFIAQMQNRIGPKEAGPWGLLQTLADGVKFFFKEDSRPEKSDPFVFRLAPYLSAVTAFVTFAIVPIAGDFNGGSGTISLFGSETFAMVADPNIGILWLLAMSSIAVYGVMLAGWASGSKYPLLGSVRASAQAISYEAALGMAVVAVVLVAGSLSTHDIVAAQVGGIRNWGILTTGVVPFVIFFIAATAELNRPPFDLVEAEQELVGGFHTEYSGIRFAMFFLAEFMNVVTMSAIMVTLFLGGPLSPIDNDIFNAIPGPIWFAIKVVIFLALFVSFRATLPRLRYDQLMDLGWKVMIPVALTWLIALSAIRLTRSNDSWNIALVIGVGLLTLIVGMVLLSAGMRAGDDAYDEALEAERSARDSGVRKV